MSLEFKHPSKLPEANIQAHFYMRCVQENIPCMLEYRVKGSRFDAIIYKDTQVICIIEVKNLGASALRKRLTKARKYAQIDRYETHGVPVIGIWNMDFIEPSLNLIKAMLHGK